MFNWAKDKLCKFKINGLSLDPLNGHIKPDGIAKCVWPLKDKPFSKIIDSNRLPKAILSLNEIKEKRNLFQLKSSSRDESTTITDLMNRIDW